MTPPLRLLCTFYEHPLCHRPFCGIFVRLALRSFFVATWMVGITRAGTFSAEASHACGRAFRRRHTAKMLWDGAVALLVRTVTLSRVKQTLPMILPAQRVRSDRDGAAVPVLQLCIPFCFYHRQPCSCCVQSALAFFGRYHPGRWWRGYQPRLHWGCCWIFNGEGNAKRGAQRCIFCSDQPHRLLGIDVSVYNAQCVLSWSTVFLKMGTT